jgi:hypothetical protein
MLLSRRTLLSSAAVFALNLPALGQIAPSDGTPASFQGNPNVNITAIDTSGGIEMPRASGQSPYFAHVSASAITATGTERPYEDLEFSWDFGDPDGVEVFTRPKDNAKVNANAQGGPEAVYCYRKPGRYTITLTIRGCAGLDAAGIPKSFVIATVTRSVTVTAFNASGGHWYFDSVHGNDRNDGRSPATPKQSLAAMTAAADIPNAAVHLKRGSSWIHDGKSYAALYVNRSPLRIDAYGSGSKPAIKSNGRAIVYVPNHHSFNDLIISNVALAGGPSFQGTPFAFVQSDSYHCSYIYLDNVDLANQSPVGYLYSAVGGGAARALGVKAWIGGGTWNCTGSNPVQIHSAVNFGATQWMFHYGLTVIGDTKNHHINPETTDGHAVYRWVKTVGKIESNFYSFCLALRVREYAGGDHSYQLVSECYFDGGMDGISCSAVVDASNIARGFIVERCAFDGLQRMGVYTASLGEGTFRDNMFWNCDRYIHINIASRASVKYYRNRHYRAGTSAHPILHHLLVAPGSPRWEITDNEFYDVRGGSKSNILRINIAEQIRAGSLIDRNQYFAPHQPDAKFMQDGTMSFAQWQAAGFDRHGRVADLRWRDPAHGKF